MQIATTKRELTAGDLSWVADMTGLQRTEPATLDATLMLATFPDGIVPSGAVVGFVTATNRFGPYSDAAVDGRQTARGHVVHTTKITAGRNEAVALYVDGAVLEDRLPTGHGLDAAGKVDLRNILYRKVGA